MPAVKRDRTKPIPGFSNPKCYARALGGCCIQMSGEHPIPKAILELIDQELGEKSLSVDVRNMAFQRRGTVQTIGIGSLESKILCTHHNNALSIFDREALAAFKAIEKFQYAVAGTRPASDPIYTLDGDRFERLLLKVLCGGIYSGIFPVEEIGVFKDVEPPMDWLHILYRRMAFPERHGLYWESPGLGEVLTTDRSIVRWTPLILEGEDLISVHGLQLTLFGFRFTLLATGPEPNAILSLAGQAYRPAGLVAEGSGARIEFSWESGPGSGEILVWRM